MKTGHERNQESLNQIFSSETDHRDYIMKQLNDAEKHLDKLEDLYDTAEYFAKEDDLIGVNHASRDMKEDTYTLRRKTLQTKSMMNSHRPIKSNAYTDGYDAYYNRLEKSDNPYFSASEPIEYQEWERGWKVAEEDYMSGLFDAQKEDDMLYNSRRPIKSSNETDYSFFQDIRHFLAKQKDKVSEMKSFDNVRLSIEFVIYNKFVSIVNVKNGSYRFNTYINLSSHEIPTYKGSDLQSFEHDFNEVCNLIGE